MADPVAPGDPPPPGPAQPASPEAPSLVQRLRAAPATFALIAMNVGVFLWISQQDGGTTSGGTLLGFGAVEALHVWGGEYWRVVTYMFLHAGWLHILMNTYMAVGWSSALERALGEKRFLLVYFLSGIAGGCASVISASIFGLRFSVGASGALFGIIGSVLALRRRQLPSFGAFFADPAIRSLLIQLGIWTAIGLTVLHLDNAAHFGGLVTGFLVTWLFTMREARTGWLLFATAFGALFIVAARPWWTPDGTDANRLLAFSKAYLTGQVVDETGAVQPWAHDVARGERFLDKGCTSGVASACKMLADHLEQRGAPDAAARSERLRKRQCDIDPGSCAKLE